MKRLVILSLILLFAACVDRGGNQAASVKAAKAGGMAGETEVVPDAHNARNSLDYIGEYKGVLQLEKAGDVNVELILSDSTYQQTVTSSSNTLYQVGRGRYEWNEAGNTITLLGSSPPDKYFVGENTLFPVDSLGNRAVNGNTLKKQ